MKQRFRVVAQLGVTQILHIQPPIRTLATPLLDALSFEVSSDPVPQIETFFRSSLVTFTNLVTSSHTPSLLQSLDISNAGALMAASTFNLRESRWGPPRSALRSWLQPPPPAFGCLVISHFHVASLFTPSLDPIAPPVPPPHLAPPSWLPGVRLNKWEPPPSPAWDPSRTPRLTPYHFWSERPILERLLAHPKLNTEQPQSAPLLRPAWNLVLSNQTLMAGH